MKKGAKILRILIFASVVFFAVVCGIWIVLRGFRYQWGEFFLRKATESSQQQEKITWLAKAVAVMPTSSTPYVEMGKIAFQNQNFKNAEKLFRWAAWFDRNNTEAYFWLAHTQINLSHLLQAQKTIERVRKIEPSHPEIKYLQARIKINENNLKEAENILKQIKNQEEKYEIIYLLSVLSQGKTDTIEGGKFQRGKAILEKYNQSENPIFQKAFLAYWWIKMGEKRMGCRLIEEIAQTPYWGKLRQWQETFKQCL